MKTADRSGVQRAVIWAALAAVLTFVGSWLHASWSRTAAADALLAVADQAAAAVDPARHAALPRATEARGPALESVRHDLRMVADQHRLGSPPVTLRRLDEQSAVYVVLTHTSPSFNDVVSIRPEMRPVFAGEVPHAVSDLHTDAQGTWMSAYAAIKRPDGSVD
ncbi:MAG: hypothetical protein KC620_24120, partial [Myxococcales bacterium]|nr:hypothetical protein [Myxococcales bacterium]